jgi:hypothetical protein
LLEHHAAAGAQRAEFAAANAMAPPRASRPTGRPSIEMRPALGVSRKLMQRSSVLLPEPLAPMITTVSPRRTLRSMPRCTCSGP